MKQLFLILVVAFVAGCDKPQWQGWVYPDRNDLTDDIPIGAFSTLGQCGASAKAIIIRLEERRDEDGELIQGDYECGYKCKPDAGIGGLNLCEKTER